MLNIAPLSYTASKEKAEAFCSSNIALCKYWGKRDEVLNLPTNSSLSISLGKLGTRASICIGESDMLMIGGKPIATQSAEYTRLFTWINSLLGNNRPCLYIHTFSNIPIGAGVASSASSFGAILKAMNSFFGWQLNDSLLAHFARLGSGSAARSLSRGFVYAKAGIDSNGVDFNVITLPQTWSEFRVGILYVSRAKKPVSSRDGMKLTVQTSPTYKGWVEYAENCCDEMIKAIQVKDFTKVGEITERNALTMHGTMMGCSPPLIYMLPKTLEIIQKVQQLRSQGIEAYATVDAGPNVKLVFLKKDEQSIKESFPTCEIISPFESAF